MSRPTMFLTVAVCLILLLATPAFAGKPLPTKVTTQDHQISWCSTLGNVIHNVVFQVFGWSLVAEPPVEPEPDHVVPVFDDGSGLGPRAWATASITRDTGWDDAH